MTKIPYVGFMKHAQKITKSKAIKTRPVLQGVIHREGYIAVTDSHRLYFATDMYEGEEKNVNPSTGETIIEGNYPDLTRLIPDVSDAKFSAKLDVVNTQKSVKLIEQAGKVDKASDLITIEHNAADTIFRTHDHSEVGVSYKASSGLLDVDKFVMNASAKYVSEAFALMKDAGLTEVSFNFYGENRPFTFIGGNLTVLILPVRTI